MSSPCCEWSDAIGTLLNADMLFCCAWSSLKYVDVKGEKNQKKKKTKLFKTANPPQEPDLNSQTFIKNGMIVRIVSEFYWTRLKFLYKNNIFKSTTRLSVWFCSFFPPLFLFQIIAVQS